VTVLDYLELTVNSTNLQGGQSAQIPIYLSSSDGVTNLVFGIQVPESILTNWSIVGVAPQLVSATLQDQTTNIQITLLTAPGQSLQGTNYVAQLTFSSVAGGTSAFVRLPISSLSALKTNGQFFSYYLANAGEVEVVQNQPLIMGTVSTNSSESLLLFGKVGVNYQLQYSTNLTDSNPWKPLLNYLQTNGVMTIQPNVTNPVIYYRLLQQ